MVIVALFAGIYVPVVRGEEEFLRRKFPEFGDYERRVPRFLPRWAPAQASLGRFSPQLYWKHREYNALLGAGAMMAALACKMICFR